MAYAQWVILHILNLLGNRIITVKNVSIDWGKFYRDNNMDLGMATSDVERTSILPGKTGDIFSCGREHSWSGTEGSLELYDEDTRICTVYWDCPWGSKHNVLEIRNYDRRSSPYYIHIGPWSSESGAIGTVELAITTAQ